MVDSGIYRLGEPESENQIKRKETWILQENKKAMKHECDSDTNCCSCAWNAP